MTQKQKELKAKHGTPALFTLCVTKAVGDLTITPEEAADAIDKYWREWDEAGQQNADGAAFFESLLCTVCSKAKGIVGAIDLFRKEAPLAEGPIENYEIAGEITVEELAELADAVNIAADKAARWHLNGGKS